MTAPGRSIVATPDNRAQLAKVDLGRHGGERVAEMAGHQRRSRAEVRGPHQVEVRVGQQPPRVRVAGDPNKTGLFRLDPEARFAAPARHHASYGTNTPRLS